MVKFKNIIFSSLFLVSPSYALTLKEYVKLSVEKDPVYKVIMLEKEKRDYIVASGLPSAPLTLSFNEQHGRNYLNDTSTSNLDATLSKTFLTTGTNISFSHTKSLQPAVDSDTTSIALEQSLYNNIFGADNRLLKRSLLEQRDMLDLQVEENFENYLVSILEQYLDYHKAYIDFEAAETNLNLAKKINQIVKAKYKSKIATQTDLDKSDLSVILREEELIQMRKTLESVKINLAETLGQSINIPEIKIESLVPANFKPKLDLEITHLRSFKIASINENISLMQSELQEKSDDMTVNFIAAYNKENSTRFSSTVKKDEAVVGIKVSIPFGDEKAHADNKLAQIQKKSAAVEKHKQKNDLHSNLANLHQSLNDQKMKVNIDRKKIQLTQRIIKEDTKRYEYGKIELESILETQNNYSDYQFQYQSDIIEYSKFYLKWLALNDQLIDYIEKL